MEPWDIAKMVYALGTLYNDNYDKLIEAIEKINNPLQKRIAYICIGIYLSGNEQVFEFFAPEYKI